MKEKKNSWLMLSVGLLMMGCAWKSKLEEPSGSVNSSALYDPPLVTLKAGKMYEFEEGVLEGRGQKYHSHYRYLRAVVIGGRNEIKAGK